MGALFFAPGCIRRWLVKTLDPDVVIPYPDDGYLYDDPNSVVVCFWDTSYGQSEDEVTASRVLREELERWTGVPLQKVEIFPGASGPGFGTVVRYASLAIGILYAGKPINEGLDGWLSVATRLRAYLAQGLVTNRNGAAALAIDAAIGDGGLDPAGIHLVRYEAIDARMNEVIVSEPIPLEFMGVVKHRFKFADGASEVVVTVSDAGVSVTPTD